MKKHQEFFDDMAKGVGLFVIAAVIVVLLIALVYGLLGYFEYNSLRLIATVLVFGVFGAFVLGLQVGKAHVKGVERGLDLKFGAKERAQQTVRPPMQQPTVAARFDDLLPKVEQRAVIVARQDSDTTPIDL
jgi:hypothetical protein